MSARLLALLPPLLLALTPTVRGEFLQINSPKLTFDAEYPDFARQAVEAVLQGEAYEFLGGAELNGTSSLRYRGETSGLNKFLARLSRCLDVTILVTFSGDLDAQTDWRVFHEPHANRFLIEIAYLSKRIDLSRLVLPEIGKPAVAIH